MLPGGTTDDPDGRWGTAFLSARLLAGAKEIGGAEGLDALLERIGFTLDVSAGPDATVVTLDGARAGLPAALAVVGRVIAAPRFNPDDFLRKVQALRDEEAATALDPTEIAGRVFDALVFGPDHPDGHPTSGTNASLQRLTLEDVQSFANAHFAPDYATLVLIGDLSDGEAARLAGSTLLNWRARGSSSPAPRPAISPTAPGDVNLVDLPGAAQGLLLVGRPWHGRDHQSYPATLIGNRVIGADFLSRLNQDLRENKGWTYRANSAFRYRKGASFWAVLTSVREDVTGQAVREVLNQLAALDGNRPITQEEFELTRRGELLVVPKRFDTPSHIADELQTIAALDLPPDQLSKEVAAIEGLKVDEVARDTASLVDPSHQIILVVGDRRAIEPQLREAGFNAVHVIDPDALFTPQAPPPVRISGAVPEPGANNARHEDVKAVLHAIVDVYNDDSALGDDRENRLNRLMSFYESDRITHERPAFFGPVQTDPIHNAREYLEQVVGTFDEIRSHGGRLRLELGDVAIRRIGTVAIVSASMTVNPSGGSRRSIRWTLTFRRSASGTWLVTHEHLDIDPAPPGSRNRRATDGG